MIEKIGSDGGTATRMIASLVVVLLVASPSQPPKAADTPKGNSTQATTRSSQTAKPANSSNPPITVVVQEPPPDPARQARQDEREERTIRASEQMVTLTKVLIVATVITLGVVGWQAFESRKSANAAKDSADIAVKTLRLAATTFLDLKGHSVVAAFDDSGNVDSFIASYRLANLSNNVARNVEVKTRYGIGDAMNHEVVSRYSALSPSKGFWIPFHVGKLTDEQRKNFEQDRFYIRLQMDVSWINPLDNSSYRTFHRILSRNKDSGDWESKVLGQVIEDYGTKEN